METNNSDCVINEIICNKCDAIFHSIGRSVGYRLHWMKSVLIEQCTRFSTTVASTLSPQLPLFVSKIVSNGENDFKDALNYTYLLNITYT